MPARAVRLDEYGDLDVLKVTDIPMPHPAEHEVVVEVRAAGINPGEIALRTGVLKELYPLTFPSGQGSDLAGVVTALGEGVTEFTVGDEVLGYSWTRSSHATHTAVPVTQLIRKPQALSWEQAGSLYVVGCTARVAVRAVDPKPGETVAVSAAAGGVGSIVVQLLALRGARVLAIASDTNADWLTAHGAIQIPYGDRLAEDLRAAAPDGIDAFIDLFGPQYVQLAVDLGVPRDRINTIIAFAKAQELGTRSEGSAVDSSREALAEIAELVASGRVELPIAATYPLEQVRDAFAELAHRHTHGKIVLVPEPVGTAAS